MFLLFDSLFTCSPSDNCSDKEDFAAMWGLHEYLVWTTGNSWLNHSSSCFSSWTLFLPVEVSTVKAIFLHSDIHILNLFLRWSMLNGKLPSSYFWSNSCMWKSTSCYSTHYYISHLNYWHIAFPICFSVTFSSLSMSCTLHSVHGLLYWIHLNQSLCHYLENSCWILIMLLQHFLTLSLPPCKTILHNWCVQEKRTLLVVGCSRVCEAQNFRHLL